MKKIKNSLKVIISLISVFVVAVAAVVTVVILNNKRKGGDDDDNLPSYALTAGQKLLVGEINAEAGSAVSSSKHVVYELSSLYTGLDVNSVQYFDESVFWTNPGNASVSAFMFNSETDRAYTALSSKVMDLDEFKTYEEGGYSVGVVNAVKNHFQLKFTKTGAENVFAVVSVENYQVIFNKMGSVYLADDFFVLPVEDNGDCYFEFYEYLNSYDNYTPFKLDDVDDLDGVDTLGNTFSIDSEPVVIYVENSGFELVDDTVNLDVDKSVYEHVTLTQTRTLSSSDVVTSELVNGSYYTYSYELKINGEVMQFDLGDYQKMSVVYAGDNYFGIFLQKIDASHNAQASGEMIYFDYELNKIVSYSAKNSNSKILYSKGALILTQEGMFSTKNEVACTKIYDFSNLNAEFYKLLSSGNFVMKDSYDNLIVYNFELAQAIDLYMESVAAYLDDNSLIFVKNNKYYLYDLKSSYSEINFDSQYSNLATNTKLFVVENDEGLYDLRSSKGTVESDLNSIIVSNDFITTTKNGKDKTYIISDDLSTASGEAVQTSSATAYAFEANGTGVIVSGEEKSNVQAYGASSTTVTDGSSTTMDDEAYKNFVSWGEDDVIYDYDDKVETINYSDGSKTRTLIKATHCIQDGNYSNYSYYDYFELSYVGQNSNGLTAYRPLRVYYRVDVVNGSPVLTITSFGHHVLAAIRTGSKDGYSTFSGKDNYIVNDVSNTTITNLKGNEGVGSLGKKDNASSLSYDYKDGTNYYYVYTGTYNNEKDVGFTLLNNNNAIYLACLFGFPTATDDTTDDRICSSANVYGDSIKVTFYFSFTGTADGSHGLNKDNCEFGQTEFKDCEFFLYNNGKIYEEIKDEYNVVKVKSFYSTDSNITNFEYYNTLYFQPVVVVLSSNKYNYETLLDFENSYIYGDNILQDIFLNDEVVSMNFEGDNFLVEGVYGYTRDANGDLQTRYNSCYNAVVNNKQSYTTDLTTLYLGSLNNFTTELVGGKLFGLTSPKQTSYSTNSSELYGDTTYIDNKIEFRQDASSRIYTSYPATGAEGAVEYTAVAKFENEEDSTKSYYCMTYNNKYYMYVDGGLNTYRYVYCIYEPEMFYLEIDYNVAAEGSETGGGIDNEIDYLKNYVQVSIGNTEKTKISYSNYWAYKNVTEKDFGDYDNTNGDKYVPYDFTNNYIRQGDVVEENGLIVEYYVNTQRKNETSAVIYEYRTNENRYFYITIDGYRYYFQVNNISNTKSYIDYWDSNKESNSDLGRKASIYLVAYKNLQQLTNSVAEFGYIDPVSSLSTYDSFLKGDNVSIEENFYYTAGKDSLYIRIAINPSNSNEFIAYYHQKNEHDRTSVYSNGHYYYVDGQLQNAQTSYENTVVTEKFNFYYNEDIIISNIPTHIHYSLVGFDVYRKDSNGNWVLQNTSINLKDKVLGESGININPYYNERETMSQKNYYLASGLFSNESRLNYYEIGIGKSDSPIRLVAKWEPAEVTVDAQMWQKSNDGYKGFIYENGVIKQTPEIIATVEPHYTKSGNAVVLNVNGLIQDEIKFSYTKSKTFADISDVLSAAGYTQGNITAAGLEYQFAGWAFVYNSDRSDLDEGLKQNGNYFPIDSNYYTGSTGTNYSQTTISNYVGDTTKITIYAFYYKKYYNFSVAFSPMGGASSQEDNRRDGIFNDEAEPVNFNFSIGYSAQSGETNRTTDYTVGYSESGYEQIAMPEDSAYYIKNFSNTFYCGESVVMRLKVRKDNYYFKKIVFENVTLLDGGSNYAKFDLTFAYDGTNWSLSYVLKTEGASYPGEPNTNQDANGAFSFTFGPNNSVTSNYIILQYDKTKNELQISISNMNWPGELTSNSDGSQRLEGSTGFSMIVYAESYTMFNEKVQIVYPDDYYDSIGTSIEEDVESNKNYNNVNKITYNRSSLISAQPLTDKDGNAIGDGTNGYIWINTNRYQITTASNISVSGYYTVAQGASGAATLWSEEDSTYDLFISRSVQSAKDNIEANPNDIDKLDDSLIVYYDSEYRMVYYLADYNNAASSHDERRDNETDLKAMDYHRAISIPYSNTRVLVIDPEQAQIYNSQNYSSSTIGINYELSYYMSSITFYGNNIGNDVTYSFDQVTRETITDGYRKYYNILNVNSVNVESDNNTRINTLENEEDKFRFFGEVYTINQKFTLSFDGNPSTAGARTYYLYVVRTSYGFTRYLLVYDETAASFSQRSETYNIKITFKEIQNKININVIEEDLYGHDPEGCDDTTSFILSNKVDSKLDTTILEPTAQRPETIYNETNNIFTADRNSGNGHVYNKEINPYVFLEQLDPNDPNATRTDFSTATSTSIKWSSMMYYNPTQTMRFSLSAKSGYIIKSFTLYVGKLEYEKDNGAGGIEKLVTFEIDLDASFEYLLRSSANESYSYTGTVKTYFTPTLIYRIKNEDGTSFTNLGYELNLTNDTMKRGLMYSNYSQNAWTYGQKDEDLYQLDYIYYLISCMYDDIKIDIVTTSYVEFLFENGDINSVDENGDPMINSLLKQDYATDTGKNYKSLLVKDNTYFSFYTENITTSIDLITGATIENYEMVEVVQTYNDAGVFDVKGAYNTFVLRYYPNGTSADDLGGLAAGTIRMIFLGTGSKIKNGLHIMATDTDHSVYFTNARFYNETLANSNKDEDAFINLEKYSGRTKDDEKIKQDKSNLNKNDKMVYMFTGKFTELGQRYTGSGTIDYRKADYFYSNYYNEDGNKEDSNSRFFVALKTYLNEIEVQTDSYLYNDYLTNHTDELVEESEDDLKTILTYEGPNDKFYYSSIEEGGQPPYAYAFDESSANKLIAIKRRQSGAGQAFSVYQLDNTYKTNSWFNDTVLSNIQYYSDQVKYQYGDGDNGTEVKTWANRMNNPDETSSEKLISELSAVKSGGLDFYWKYYDIAGYYLNYIMIEIADLETYYVIDVSSLQSAVADETSQNLLIGSFNIESDSGITYAFELHYVYETEYGYFKFCPVGYKTDDNGNIVYEKDDAGNVIYDSNGNKIPAIDIFNSVCLMSNNIKVAFVSNAYDYHINYYGSYGSNQTRTSTVNDMQTKLVDTNEIQYNAEDVDGSVNYYQTIYYDTMVSLDRELIMSGYTFIGWGSQKYYNGSNELTLRYSETANIDEAPQWSSASSWYDPTTYFVKEITKKEITKDANGNIITKDSDGNIITANTGEQDAKNYYNYYNSYSGTNPLPGSAFYVKGGYFMTDTGNKNTGLSIATQNYNFFCNYVTIFSSEIGKWKSGGFGVGSNEETRNIDLYPIFKVNTYAIQFNANNSKGDKYYNDFGTEDWELELASDNIRFSLEVVNGKPETGTVTTNTTNYVAYVTFDTNQWVYTSSLFKEVLTYKYVNGAYGQDTRTTSGVSLLYAFLGNSPVYTITDMSDSDNVSTLAIDMFGYTWLGWYYTKIDDTYQNKAGVDEFVYYDKNKGTSVNKLSTMIFGSKYSFKKKGKVDLPTFNSEFIETMQKNSSIFDFDYKKTQPLTYYGQHLSKNATVNTNDGYVYFYDYRGTSAETSETINGNSVAYLQIKDYLNSFDLDASNNMKYEGEFTSNILFSYYDTSLSSDGYQIKYNSLTQKYYLSLNRSVSGGTFKYITLFAAWSQNDYDTVYTSLDTNEDTSKLEKFGSTEASDVPTGGNTYWFNDDELEKYLLSDIMQPSRIGYDFIGWSFNYIPTNSAYYDAYSGTVNTANPVLKLNKDMISYYASLDSHGKSSKIESNVLMINGDRVKFSAGGDDNEWLLNDESESCAEQLGDQESINSVQRYVYLFPVWRAQTFSINISLNIKKEELKNLYEKDSSFAVALYDSVDYDSDNGVITISDATKFTGVSSNYYTFNKNGGTETDGSKYNDYYADIVANICFEIEFDQRIETAKLTFANKTYYLKDLFVTSAGYYFLGLMYNSTYAEDDEQYMVQNTLLSYLKLVEDASRDSTLNHDNDTGKITYFMDEAETEKTAVFDLALYTKLYNSKQNSNSSESTTAKLLSELNEKENGLVYAADFSTNFGYVNFYANGYSTRAKEYNIMSEVSDGQYYHFIIVDNVKYYITYYYYDGGKIYDSFTFDRTFLYYNETSGTLTNKYIVRFDASGKAYYVKESYTTNGSSLKYSLEGKIRIAIYKIRRNTTLIEKDRAGLNSIVEYNPSSRKDGSLATYSSTTARIMNPLANDAEGYSATITFKTTREFTLYAHWKMRSIKSEIYNGNNGSSGTKGSNNNEGLGGWYSIKNRSDLTTIASSDTENYKTEVTSGINNNDEPVSLTYDFYSEIDYQILPYYNGRFISELKLEFDTLDESGDGAVSFWMKHNTITFKFRWDNEERTPEIDSIEINGVNAGNVWVTYGRSEYNRNLFKISELSYLDKYSLGKASVSTKSGNIFDIFGYNEGNSDADKIQGRTYINDFKITLKDIMTSVKFTCKYSVQTFKVEVYNVVDIQSRVEGTNYATIDEMLLYSNKVESNASAYNSTPYISDITYSNTKVASMSTDCAFNATSYNVPFYYFMLTKPANSDDTNDNFYGTDFIYGKSYGYNGSTLSSFNNSLDNLKLDSTVYTPVGSTWYLCDDSGGQVSATAYSGYSPITKNTSIYGLYYIDGTLKTQVVFYYWDVDQEKYVQYKNNEEDYISGSGSKMLENTKADGSVYYTVTELPSLGLGSWYDDMNLQFLGFVLITGEDHSSFINTTSTYNFISDRDYEYSTRYIKTTGDFYEAVKKRASDYTNEGDDEYKSHIGGLSILDMFKYRLTVADNKYFIKQQNIGGSNVSILDGVRLNVKVNLLNGSTMDVQKNFKMLNVNTELTGGYVYYAIPIYEKFELSIDAVNIKGGTLTLTTNSNMISSNVFDATNNQYTVYYDPLKDLRVGVTSDASASLATLTKLGGLTSSSTNLSSSTSGYYNFTEMQKGGYDVNSGESDDANNVPVHDYGYLKFKFDGSGSTRIYLYYVNRSGVAIYSSSYLYVHGTETEIQASIGNTKAKIEPYDSPLDIDLGSDYQEIYEEACKEIETYESNPDYQSQRELLIYIALQIAQSHKIIVNSSVSDLTNAENQFILRFNDIQNNDRYATVLSTTKYTRVYVKDEIDFFKLVYSIAEYYVLSQYGSEDARNIPTLKKSTEAQNNTYKYILSYSYDTSNSTQYKHLNSTESLNSTSLGVKAGDIMKADKSVATTVYNVVTGESKTVYRTDDNLENNISMAMFVCGRDSETPYIIEVSGSVVCRQVTNDINNDAYAKFQSTAPTGYYEYINGPFTSGKNGYYLEERVFIEDIGYLGCICYYSSGTTTVYVKRNGYAYLKSVYIAADTAAKPVAEGAAATAKENYLKKFIDDPTNGALARLNSTDNKVPEYNEDGSVKTDENNNIIYSNKKWHDDITYFENEIRSENEEGAQTEYDTVYQETYDSQMDNILTGGIAWSVDDSKGLDGMLKFGDKECYKYVLGKWYFKILLPDQIYQRDDEDEGNPIDGLRWLYSLQTDYIYTNYVSFL